VTPRSTHMPIKMKKGLLHSLSVGVAVGYVGARVVVGAVDTLGAGVGTVVGAWVGIAVGATPAAAAPIICAHTKHRQNR